MGIEQEGKREGRHAAYDLSPHKHTSVSLHLTSSLFLSVSTVSVVSLSGSFLSLAIFLSISNAHKTHLARESWAQSAELWLCPHLPQSSRRRYMISLPHPLSLLHSLSLSLSLSLSRPFFTSRSLSLLLSLSHTLILQCIHLPIGPVHQFLHQSTSYPSSYLSYSALVLVLASTPSTTNTTWSATIQQLLQVTLFVPLKLLMTHISGVDRWMEHDRYPCESIREGGKEKKLQQKPHRNDTH